MDTEALREIVADLAHKPGHEKVRGQLLRLLTDGLATPAAIIDFERVLAEVRRRADGVLLKEGEHFTHARRRIRDALREDGVADEIDRLVTRLLDSVRGRNVA